MASPFPNGIEGEKPSRGQLRSNSGARNHKKKCMPSATESRDALVHDDADARKSRDYKLLPDVNPQSAFGSCQPASANVQGRKPRQNSANVHAEYKYFPPHNMHPLKHASQHHHNSGSGMKKPSVKHFSNPSCNKHPKHIVKEKDRSWTQSFRSLSNEEIKTLCQSGITADEIAFELHKKIKYFQMTLQSKRISANISSIVFILSKLTTLLDGHSDSENKNYALQILGEAFSSRCPQFHLQLQIYVKSLQQTAHNTKRFRYPVAVYDPVQQVFQLFRNLLIHIPAVSWSCLPVDELAQTIARSPELSQHSVEIQAITSLRDQMRELTISQSAGSKAEWDNSEYREIQILPTWQEVCTSSPPTKLRANIVKGCYNDWMHYYDVQFRLLREDFIAPLRSGICGFLDGVQRRKLHDIKVYEHVIISEPIFSREGTLYVIQFDTSKFQKYNWEHSKRLLFGSLLGLSCDHFQNTVIFATVANRDIKKLQEGKLEVRFQSNENILSFCHSKVFTMVESVAYYEACCHILHSLQIAETETMPFTSYLVDNRCNEVLSPQYLRDGNSAYDLSDLYGKDVKSTVFSKPDGDSLVDVLDITQWPASDELELDQSQFIAIQMALTQEIAVIQGPPGTGKTYQKQSYLGCNEFFK